ncbi:MAG: hypothetical protein A3B91_01220 [Candidatus Yanofskybacteria bacterium RIFCSPHIGHO2_02_FULL_41_29]|uniref:DUF4406 domain-containing protein n=1 Tax=Candidatus Yanofskybacteria bacterium RIFCSPHIGHO2_01_FULL_41_53 TaxID=1802663 RepID=A0A1F8EFP4_9BACT|nr:MAG: hypothetical protein A2650_01465 [Candidatus Yanofskybacteria bacterium RIFCSPHIGHO2_01_FULL_41_53]OGN11379.1 MAG: hypothetical protein A3B91_01220 [Candidatus Yanofskybacteria bacterium RIFCSPHIGHO2_02_FULL_41_29]OGN17749.1 MAG: hypothetical protein A3F48_00765 [Candidatus Yanofskybacteria bacterium RIFCSPHIGHO2_12_FULL_41_9]OGN28946.1 MAG: hypothetical protein A3H54_02290 [Candidatus Yanofskybacteria bacterium RIFCSPLOWO2_02_FULL_41_13]OGN33340.1 MAG: hypothetical protein A3F98_01630 
MLKYYSDDNLKHIKKAKDYKELLTIAITVLNVMLCQYPLTPITMVCGPISTGGAGSRSRNLEVFNRAIDRLSAGGLFVFSQMPFEDDMERIYKSDPSLQGLRLLEEFYLPIFETRFIELLCFLPGWTDSIGATWEHQQAERLSIPRIYLSEYYISDL